jgi:PAS domain S-box-containing protein
VTWLANLPVQRKLGYAMLLTTTVAMVVACGVVLTLQFAGYRQGLEQTVATLARVIADNSTAALAFKDTEGARGTLAALQAEKQIVAAALYGDEGRVLASYSAREGELAPYSPPPHLGVRFEGGSVVAVEPVIEGSRRLGTLYMRASLDQVIDRMQTYALIAIAVLVACILLAGLLATVLGRTLAQPILALARTADAVSAGRDYSLRAQRHGNDELGRLTGAFNAMLAKTQEAIDALRESEQRFRVMADNAPVMIWLGNTRAECLWVNQRWLDFTGRTLAEEQGSGWADVIHPDDRATALRTYHDGFERRTPFQMECRLLRRDGVYRWILGHGVPRFDASGDFTGYIGSLIDVSDRKLAEQEIAQARDKALAASRAKDDFLAALSHELRTPLTPVLLLASEEATNPRHTESVRADFEMIAKNVALEARLIDDLLDLTRITRGKLVLDRRAVDAHAILNDALSTVRADFIERHIELKLDLAAQRHVIMADPVRLQQVFWNVLKNAVKFTAHGGRVTVVSQVVAGNLVIRVTDTGIGMTTAELDRIFEAFSQGEHGNSHKFGGLGLGLAISRRLVELQSGTITASSLGRGQGATFEINFPLVDVSASTSPIPAPLK